MNTLRRIFVGAQSEVEYPNLAEGRIIKVLASHNGVQNDASLRELRSLRGIVEPMSVTGTVDFLDPANRRIQMTGDFGGVTDLAGYSTEVGGREWIVESSTLVSSTRFEVIFTEVLQNFQTGPLTFDQDINHSFNIDIEVGAVLFEGLEIVNRGTIPFHIYYELYGQG